MIRQMRVMDIEDLLRPAAPLSAWSSGNLSDSSGFPIFRQGRAASLQSIFILSLIKLPISRYLKWNEVKKNERCIFIYSLYFISALIWSSSSVTPYNPSRRSWFLSISGPAELTWDFVLLSQTGTDREYLRYRNTQRGNLPCLHCDWWLGDEIILLCEDSVTDKTKTSQVGLTTWPDTVSVCQS